MITLLYVLLTLQIVAIALIFIDAKNGGRKFTELMNFTMSVMIVGLIINVIAVCALMS